MILRPTQVLRPPASSSGFFPLWKGLMPLGDVGGKGAGLSRCRITLGLDVPLPVPAWGAGVRLRPRRNSVWGAFLLLLAESQFSPNSARIGSSLPSPNLNCSPPGERLSVYLVWLKSPSQGSLSCSDPTSKGSLLSSSAKQQGIYCGAGPEGIEGIQQRSVLPGGDTSGFLGSGPRGLLSHLAPASQGATPSLREKARQTRPTPGGVSGSLRWL